MTIQVEVPGTATGIRVKDNGVIEVYTIGGPPSGVYSIDVDPNVPKQTILNTINMLVGILSQMP